MLYDAYALNNVRVMNIGLKDTPEGKNLTFMPYRPSNNPAAFSDLSKRNPSSPQYFAEDFPVKNPIVFFFWVNEYLLFRSFNFFSYLRANYPGCKLVCWITNPAHQYPMFAEKSSVKEFVDTFDCVLTYNQIDAIDYALTYFENPHSVLPFEQKKEEFDVFFVGRPKDRLEKILRAYERFKTAGLTCNFYINDIHNPPFVPGIHFNQFLRYKEVVNHILRSRAVLDISQQGTYGLTVRYFESLAYNKNFITDNAFYRQERFRSPKLFLIDRSLEIDKEQFMSAAKLSSNYRNEYSPLRMISFLESLLNS